MKRFFFTFILVFILVFPSFGRDFGVKPLEPEAQARLDVLVEKLGETSNKKREKTIGEILKFGESALETLQKAEKSQDFTTAETAKYCVSLIAPGLIRTGDSPRVQAILQKYSVYQPIQKMIQIARLGQLPLEESLVPLMRIVTHEKDPLAARFAVLSIWWRLPFTQPVPAFSVPVPEAKVFPDPVAWATRNDENQKKRVEILEKLREYLASEATSVSESSESVGKQFLAQIIDLEKNAQAENADAAPFEEIFEKLYDELETEDPATLAFLHEFLYFAADLLIQNGHEQAASDFFLRQTALGLTGFGKATYQIGDERNLELRFREFLIQTLIRRGHWTFVPQETARLFRKISTNEKIVHCGIFTSFLTSIGEYRKAWELLKNVRRTLFMDLKSDEEKADEETTVEFQKQLAQVLALDACKQKDYVKAKEVLRKCFELKGEPDVDSLILAWKIAVFTKDEPWQNELERRIDDLLAKTEKRFPDASEKFLRAPELNAYAWLAANTNRKLDEALKYAEEAVALLPDAVGIRDTLAYVHFARGDYEKAFEIQSQATAESFTEVELWVNLERIRVYKDEKNPKK